MTNPLYEFLNDPLQKKGLLYWDEHRFSPRKEFLSILSLVFELAKNDPENRSIILLSEDTISMEIIEAYKDTHDIYNDIRIRSISYKKEHPRVSFDNKLVLLFEVNTFIRKLNNKIMYRDDPTKDEFKMRKSPVVDIYNSMCSSSCRVVIATDRPVRSSYLDLYLIGNLMNGNMFPNITSHFFKVIKNEDLVVDALKGYVWYVSNKRKRPFAVSRNVVKAKMSLSQLKVYSEVIANEISDRIEVQDTKRKIPYESISMLSSQAVCNFVYMNRRDKYSIESSPWGKDSLKRTKTDFEKLHMTSPKFKSIILKILSEKGDHIIYSKFTDLKGIRLLHSFLLYVNINSILYTGPGSISSFNDSVWNPSSDTNVILLSDDAFERGTSNNFERDDQLDSATHVHIVESTHEHWKENDILDNLINHVKYKEKNITKRHKVIKVIRYITEFHHPIEKVVRDKRDRDVYISQGKTSDEIIHEKSNKTFNVSKLMMNIIKRASL